MSRLTWVALVAFLSSNNLPAATLQLAAEIPLGMYAGAPFRDAQPVFLSDDSVALLLRGELSAIAVFSFTGNDLQKRAVVPDPDKSTSIFAASQQRILLWSIRGADLYSGDLQSRWPIDTKQRRISLFPRAGVVGLWHAGLWAAVRLEPAMPVVRDGSGQSLSVSDELVLTRQDNRVLVETLEGRTVGSISVPKSTFGAPIAELAGPGRIFLHFGDVSRIVDLGGKEMVTLPKQDGWGLRHGWSADGSRILFDQYTRNTSPLNRAIESIASVVAAIPENSNGETIVVVDSNAGDECFRLENHTSMLGAEGAMHADISPSGKFVGIASLTTFSVYRLPETCKRR